MLMHPPPRIGPVIIDLAAEQMAADAPHMLVLAEALEVLVTHEDVVDVLNLERKMVEAGPFVLHAEECVMVDVFGAGVDAAELADDVVRVAGVDIVRAHQAQHVAEPLYGFAVLRCAHHRVADTFHGRWTLTKPNNLAGTIQRFRPGVDGLAHHLNRRRGCDTMHDLDRVAVGFSDADALAAPRFVDIFNAGRTGVFGQGVEVVFAGGGPGEAKESRRAFFGDMDVMGGVGAAHIERGRRAPGAHHAEGTQKFFLLVEIRRAKATIGKLSDLDDGHCGVLLLGIPTSS